MIILIAESKTMDDREIHVSPSLFDAHRPAGESRADAIMSRVAGMTAGELAATVKISPSLAAKLLRMAYEFPNKSLGLRAIEAYTGVVFKNFDYRTLSDTEKNEADSQIRIVSSLYGWLRPDDYVKPYRFDYTTKLAPDGSPLCAYMQNDVTTRLLDELRETGTTEILNLLPADAAKCIDWKLVEPCAKVWKAEFMEHDGSALRTPHAGKLKAMRGQLLRAIITGNLTTPDQIARFENDILMPADTPPVPGTLAFYV